MVEAFGGSVDDVPARRGRPSLDGIRNRYRVDEDTLVEWRPKVFGKLSGPFSSAAMLTSAEARMLDDLAFERGLLGLHDFHGIHEEAWQVSDERVCGASTDGHKAAFRHAFWSARLSQAFGADWAAAFTTAHEATPGNTAGNVAMDLYNNGIGIGIAQAHPGATPERLAGLVAQALDQGELLVINRAGDLAWSDEVARGDTGRDRLEPGEGRRTGREPFA